MLKETLNHDCAGIATRAVRFVNEELKCQSANGLSVMVHDVARIEEYLAALVKYKGHVMKDPVLDLCKTHPTIITVEVPEISVVDGIENESLSDWCRLILLIAHEIMGCPSSRMSSGLNVHDSRKFDLLAEKANNLVQDYIKTILPLDVPETIPSVAGITNGAQGI